MSEEKITHPIVEHGQSASLPHPVIEGIEGAVGHPDEHAQAETVVHEGRVIAEPPGQDVSVVLPKSDAEIEEMLKEGADQGGRWLGAFFRRRKLEKAA